jgi:hypothetical protein
MDEIMAAMELLCRLIGLSPSNLLREEIIFIEAELFSYICAEFKEIGMCQGK